MYNATPCCSGEVSVRMEGSPVWGPLLAEVDAEGQEPALPQVVPPVLRALHFHLKMQELAPFVAFCVHFLTWWKAYAVLLVMPIQRGLPGFLGPGPLSPSPLLYLRI